LLSIASARDFLNFVRCRKKSGQRLLAELARLLEVYWNGNVLVASELLFVGCSQLPWAYLVESPAICV
jgi:hypothetical protein